MALTKGLGCNYSPFCNRLRFSAGMYQIKTLAAFGPEIPENELFGLYFFKYRK